MTRFTRIIGHMVTRNEMARYLPNTMRWLRQITETVCVLDDNSDDGTFEWLREEGARVSRRPSLAKSFAQDESAFRATAWAYMEDSLNPTGADWILCVDADEFVLAANADDTRQVLTETVEKAIGLGAVTLPVREIFGFEDNAPMLRVDGFWGDIFGCRLVRWRPGAHFAPRVEGGGSVPAGWCRPVLETDDLAIMHLGYARPEDRIVKHARYSATVGHNPQHVASILEPPKLLRWRAPLEGLL